MNAALCSTIFINDIDVFYDPDRSDCFVVDQRGLTLRCPASAVMGQTARRKTDAAISSSARMRMVPVLGVTDIHVIHFALVGSNLAHQAISTGARIIAGRTLPAAGGF